MSSNSNGTSFPYKSKVVGKVMDSRSRSWIQDPLSLYINVDKKKSVKNPAKNKIKHLQSASPVHADRCRK